MKKVTLFIFGLLAIMAIQAQVGINTETPRTTMHIVPTNTGATTAEGFIAPNLTRAQVIAKDIRYTTAEKGAIVYVIDLSGTLTTKTAKITQIGYYYFDGAIWQQFINEIPLSPAIPTEPWQVQGSTTQQATTNTQNIYQMGSVAIGTGSAATSAYKLDVAGTSNVSGNSRVGSSTVMGAQTIGTTLAVTGATTLSNALTVAGTTNLDGATNTRTTNITGTLNYKPVGATLVANTYLRTDGAGNASWQALPITATTEPWQVQASATVATTNAQNIYQQGNVAIGATAATAASAYKLDVTGASNVSGNSKVGSSTVVGAQTVGTTLAVTGATTLGATGTAGTTTMATINGRTQANGNLAVTGDQSVGQTLVVTGTSTLTGNVGIGAASNATYKLQVTGASNVTGNSRVASSTVVGAQTVGTNNKIGGTTTINTSAQLELADNNKAFLPNRVPLTSATDNVTVPNPVNGMMVYNTASVPAQGLSSGYYYWRDGSWNRLVDKIPQTTLNLRDLQTATTSSANDANNTDKGALMNFGTIVIPEDGSYAFTFRLYGTISPRPTTIGTSIFYYIALMSGTTIKDSAEMDLVSGTGSVLTYSITLGATFQAGQVVTFRLSNHPSSAYPWALTSRPNTTAANRTSMVWWKL